MKFATSLLLFGAAFSNSNNSLIGKIHLMHCQLSPLFIISMYKHHCAFIYFMMRPPEPPYTHSVRQRLSISPSSLALARFVVLYLSIYFSFFSIIIIIIVAALLPH